MAELSLAQVFAAFVRLGATAFGGPAMMGHLKAELVGRRRWLADQDFAEGMALCQIIPGATIVQMSTYIGYRLRGTSGALAAAVGFILPSFLVMILLSALYLQSGSVPMVRALFRGLSAVVVAIVLNACITLGRTTVRGWQGIVLAALALLALTLKVNFVVVLAGAAALAIPLYRRAEPAAAKSMGSS
jgi:chromate transporter